MLDWSKVFKEGDPNPGASEVVIAQFVDSIRQPLSPEEIADANQSGQDIASHKNPDSPLTQKFDPASWEMPQRPLSQSYLSFLRWSDGGSFVNGDREFDFFSTSDSEDGVRAMTLAHHFPKHMPGALPFAMEGGGTFYCFDMRAEPVNDEYPIVAARADDLDWKTVLKLADLFEKVCRGKKSVDAMWSGAQRRGTAPPERVDVYLIRSPKGGIKQVRAVCSHLCLTIPMSELSGILKNVPYRLCHNVPYLPAARLVAEMSGDDPCLGVFAVDDMNQPISLAPWKWC